MVDGGRDSQRLRLQGVRGHRVAPVLPARDGHLDVGPHRGHAARTARGWLGGGGPVDPVQLWGGGGEAGRVRRSSSLGCTRGPLNIQKAHSRFLDERGGGGGSILTAGPLGQGGKREDVPVRRGRPAVSFQSAGRERARPENPRRRSFPPIQAAELLGSPSGARESERSREKHEAG